MLDRMLRGLQLHWEAEPSGGGAPAPTPPPKVEDYDEPAEVNPDTERVHYDDDEPAAAAPPAPRAAKPVEKAPEPEPAAEVTPAPVAPPAWMEQILGMQIPGADPAAPGGDLEIPPELADSMLPEKELRAILAFVNQRAGQGTEAAQRATERLEQLEDAQARRTIVSTLQAVQRNAYNGVFANDPVLQGNEKAAAMADKIMQQWLDQGAFNALHPKLRDDSSLRMAAHPMFPALVAAMTKILVLGSDTTGEPTTVIPRGAEVASATAPRRGQAKTSPFSESEKKVMRAHGVNVADAERAWKLKHEGGHGSFDDYDSVESEG